MGLGEHGPTGHMGATLGLNPGPRLALLLTHLEPSPSPSLETMTLTSVKARKRESVWSGSAQPEEARRGSKRWHQPASTDPDPSAARAGEGPHSKQPEVQSRAHSCSSGTPALRGGVGSLERVGISHSSHRTTRSAQQDSSRREK